MSPISILVRDVLFSMTLCLANRQLGLEFEAIDVARVGALIDLLGGWERDT